MTRPRLLDLFCGAGGAAMGYHRAGFDVVGVDNRPQPRYPFEFHQDDAMTHPLDGFDVIHASPPCQDHSRSYKPTPHGTGWMLAATRERLMAIGLPWVIENVPGAPLRPDIKLCGCQVGLTELERERWFETNWSAPNLMHPCFHADYPITVAGHGEPSGPRMASGRSATVVDWRRVMGIDWMTRDELAQAIPPAYTEYIGKQLLEHIRATEQCA